MPGYYDQRPVAGQLPPTPPDSALPGTYGCLPYGQDSFASHQSIDSARHDAYDYQQAYMQPAIVNAASAYPYQQGSFQSSNSLPPIQAAYYEPTAAPILPTLRINERDAYLDACSQRLQAEQQTAAAAAAYQQQQRQSNKEEKPTGGVSAKLDYDMERMTDFVTEAAQSIFQRPISHPSFRKWVNQVLSATRLPSATILLSLHYFNDRMANYPKSIDAGSDNEVYRLLSVSLILGSKFLDDNTFINRSWSDVTSIKVSELNFLEMKWLHLINYQLHIDPKMDNGLPAWIDAWLKYDSEYAAKHQPTKLAPLDTNVYRNAHTRDTRYSPYPTPYTASSRSFDAPLSARSSQYSTPYSATDLWTLPTDRLSLEDYYQKPAFLQSQVDAQNAARALVAERERQAAYAYSQSAQPSYYSTTSYGSAWDPQAWNSAHRYDCNCSTCAYQQHYRPYAMASAYAAQTVMG